MVSRRQMMGFEWMYLMTLAFPFFLSCMYGYTVIFFFVWFSYPCCPARYTIHAFPSAFCCFFGGPTYTTTGSRLNCNEHEAHDFLSTTHLLASTLYCPVTLLITSNSTHTSFIRPSLRRTNMSSSAITLHRCDFVLWYLARPHSEYAYSHAYAEEQVLAFSDPLRHAYRTRTALHVLQSPTRAAKLALMQADRNRQPYKLAVSQKRERKMTVAPQPTHALCPSVPLSQRLSAPPVPLHGRQAGTGQQHVRDVRVQLLYPAS